MLLHLSLNAIASPLPNNTATCLDRMEDEVSGRIYQIKGKLQQAIVTFGGSTYTVCGAAPHRFGLKPPLDISKIDAFESRYEVILPVEYRMFLHQVGNGGAGPGYGMFSLEEGLRYQRFDIPSDILKTPFPHQDSFNPLEDEDPLYDELERKVENGEITESEFKNLFARMMEYQTAGTIVLCDEGCGHLHRLIVSGSSRGEVWMDSTCSDGGYFSLQASFLDWYERWIDGIIEGKSGNWWFEARWFSK